MAGFLQYILQIIEDAAIYCIQILFPDSPSRRSAAALAASLHTQKTGHGIFRLSRFLRKAFSTYFSISHTRSCTLICFSIVYTR